MKKHTKDFYWNIGNRIRTLRMKQNRSVEQLAEKADISTKYLYQIENGQVSFSTEILFKICNALGVKSTTLLSEENTDVGHALLCEMMGRFTETDKEYIKRILLEHFKELIQNSKK